MPSLKSMISAFCFCLLMTFCAVSAKADTTYTYTGAPYAEGAFACPPECNFTGSFTLATPLPPNASVAISTFAFNSGPLIFTSLTNGPFGVSTNAAGVIDNWGIDMVDVLDAGGDIAEIFSSPGEDQRVFGSPNPPNGLKFYAAADSFASGVWTSSTSTGVPEPSSALLLGVALLGLAAITLKKMPSPKGIISALCFCLLMTLCAVSAKADTTYTYTGRDFVEGAFDCPELCNFTGSFTLANPLPPNAVGVPINTFAFRAGPYTFTNLSNGPFAVSTNSAGVIDSWLIDYFVDPIDAGGDIALFFGSPGGDQIQLGFPNPPNDIKFCCAADSFGVIPGGVWTASTSTRVPEPTSGTLLIVGLVGLASLALKKSL